MWNFEYARREMSGNVSIDNGVMVWTMYRAGERVTRPGYALPVMFLKETTTENTFSVSGVSGEGCISTTPIPLYTLLKIDENTLNLRVGDDSAFDTIVFRRRTLEPSSGSLPTIKTH